MKALRSIRWRLQLWYGLLIAALLGGFVLTAYFFERSTTLDRADDELQRLVLELNIAVRRRLPQQPPGDGTTRPTRATPTGSAIESVLTRPQLERGFYAAVWRRNQTPFTASANAPAPLPQPDDGLRALRWRGTRREAMVSSEPGDITLVGRDLAPDLSRIAAFGWRLAAGAVALFAVTLAIGGWLVTTALRPIRDISEAATKIAIGDLSRRISTRDAESELGELAATLNATFARLEAAFAQQGRFTADAAHELRTPVSVILTHVQNALGAESLADEQREALEACQRAAQRMRRLIDSLLQLARLDAGEDALRAEPLDLASVTSECLELIRPLAAERKIVVQAEFTEARVRGDRALLGQVVTNLLANAVHHNREAGEIRVTTLTEHGRAVVRVADSGPGIPPEHLPHIFERFYRVDKARTGTSGRTGLGLAISKAIVDAHGGEIAAQNAAGAVFTVRLPAVA